MSPPLFLTGINPQWGWWKGGGWVRDLGPVLLQLLGQLETNQLTLLGSKRLRKRNNLTAESLQEEDDGDQSTCLEQVC